jgi:hypothetical protein
VSPATTFLPDGLIARSASRLSAPGDGQLSWTKGSAAEAGAIASPTAMSSAGTNPYIVTPRPKQRILWP